MGKLTSLKPRLKTIGSRLAPAAPATRQEAEAQRHHERDRSQHWRAWYKTTRWQKLRQEVLVRDAYICQRTGVVCIGKHPAPNSPVADHKKPHHGDEQLFWDINNLHCVSKAYHDSEKQKEERAQARW
ncbi:HNH endonuclease [Rhizobium sp. 32_C3_N1_1]|uniref:HNH endonuclease n=1 Tax=Rhizobium sp. 32_C3_N1_1 TaxID=3240771 RepID=UPI003F275DC1